MASRCRSRELAKKPRQTMLKEAGQCDGLFNRQVCGESLSFLVGCCFSMSFFSLEVACMVIKPRESLFNIANVKMKSITIFPNLTRPLLLWSPAIELHCKAMTEWRIQHADEKQYRRDASFRRSNGAWQSHYPGWDIGNPWRRGASFGISPLHWHTW